MERQTAANDSRKSIWLRKLHLPFTNCGRFRDSQANAEEAKLHFIAKDHLLALEDPSGMIIQFTY